MPTPQRLSFDASPTVSYSVVPSTAARVVRAAATAESRLAASRANVSLEPSAASAPATAAKKPKEAAAATASTQRPMRSDSQARMTQRHSATVARPAAALRTRPADPPLFDASPPPRMHRREGDSRAAWHATPADAAGLWEALNPDDQPMTATQEAIPAADGFCPPSPPPLFSLRSASRGRSAAPAEDPTLSDAERAELWASSARAYFKLIDQRPLRTERRAKPPQASQE
jgi:hypothetical protein